MGRVIVYLDSNPKDRSIASILEGYGDRVRSRGISLQFFEPRRGSKNYESELSRLPGNLVLLDERGISMNSEEMADWLARRALASFVVISY